MKQLVGFVFTLFVQSPTFFGGFCSDDDDDPPPHPSPPPVSAPAPSPRPQKILL